MNIFGFDIIRVKKKERKEASSLVNIVSTLEDCLSDAIDTIDRLDCTDYDIANKEIMLLNQQVHSITALMFLYEENKYARLFQIIKISDATLSLEKNVSMLNDMVFKYLSIKNRLEHVRGQVHDDDDDDDDCDDDYKSFMFKHLTGDRFDKLESFVDEMEECVVNQKIIVTRLLLDCLTAIQYDIFRIASGVDIIRSHKRLKQIFPKDTAVYEIKMTHKRP